MSATICTYTGGRDRDVADFILSIQNGEAGLSLSIEEQPYLMDIANAYRGGGFWIASDDGDGALKKFFVAPRYRGNGGPAVALLNEVLKRARALDMADIVLDTPSVVMRSHAFYERNGFWRAAARDLPGGYRYPDRASILYRLQPVLPS
jgi:GNAT superfamily N-acetyltransferase